MHGWPRSALGALVLSGRRPSTIAHARRDRRPMVLGACPQDHCHPINQSSFSQSFNLVWRALNPGERREVMTREAHLAPVGQETHVFDGSDIPKKVEILTADAFASAAGNSFLRSVTLIRADSPPTHWLTTAFPGLGRIISGPDPILTEGLGADIYPDMVVGVQAKASILAPNLKCGTSAITGVVILQKIPERA